MLRYFRGVARRLRKIPNWITYPLLFVEVVVLLTLFAWVYVTRSVETVEIPNVTGRSVQKARLTLQEYDLGYRILERSSTRTPEDQVIRQVPQPGERIMETRTVELYVSKGPEMVEVPELIGQTLFSARNELNRLQAGASDSPGPLLNLGNIARVYRNGTEPDQIIQQNPSPGRTVVRGTQVDVLVSKGEWPRRTVIPDLTGRKVPEAESALRENHLEVGRTRYVLDAEKPPFVVLSQSPSSGQIVRRDRPVSLTVNLSKEAQVAPRRYTFVRVTPPLSLEPKKLRVKLIDRRGERVVYDQEVEPGKKVEFLVSVRGDAQLIIYWNGEIHQFRRLEYER